MSDQDKEATQHLITREIGIDMGHRVTHHGSKCRNLHGHRYTIQVTVKGPLFVNGEQQGMVLDYGFLKELMMEHIDEPCDHGLALWADDPWTLILIPYPEFFNTYRDDIARKGYATSVITNKFNTGGKFYIVPFVPTAENLAKHWYERLKEPIHERTNKQGEIHSVLVYETPNCSARYPAI